MEKQLKNYRKPLSILGPLMTVALGGAGLLCPPLLLALPVLVVWLDGRVGGWWATAAMGLVLACLGYVALGTFGAAAGLLLCLPAVVVLGLMRGGMRFGNGLLLSCGVSLAMLAGLFGLAYWALGADPVAWAMAWLRQTLSALPADNLWTYLLSILAAVDEATTADLTAVAQAAQVWQSGPIEALLDKTLPMMETTLRLQLPSLLLSTAAMQGAATYLLPSYWLDYRRSRGGDLPKDLAKCHPPVAFSRLSIPGWIVLPMVLLMAVALFVNFSSNETYLGAAIAVQNLVEWVFALQGLALISFLLQRAHVRLAPRIISVTVIFLIPISFVRYLLFMTGLFDGMLHIRKYFEFKDKMMKGGPGGPPEQGGKL